jgi:hypothetical protein
MGVLILTALWSALVVVFPDLGFMVGPILTLIMLLPGALASVWAAKAWRRRPAGPGVRLAPLLVLALVLATMAVLLLDDGYRDSLRWRLSRGAFEAAAADLATSTPDVGTFHDDGRFVGIVWVAEIDVYGRDVLFHLPGYLDNAVIAYDPTGTGRNQFGAGRPLGDGWYRYWFHF